MEARQLCVHATAPVPHRPAGAGSSRVMNKALTLLAVAAPGRVELRDGPGRTGGRSVKERRRRHQVWPLGSSEGGVSCACQAATCSSQSPHNAGRLAGTQPGVMRCRGECSRGPGRCGGRRRRHPPGPARPAIAPAHLHHQEGVLLGQLLQLLHALGDGNDVLARPHGRQGAGDRHGGGQDQGGPHDAIGDAGRRGNGSLWRASLGQQRSGRLQHCLH